MTRDRPPADRPLPDRLPLGAASRMLGVDPDTLRRWADEGRVPAFTTPGGHRRFERAARPRLISSRRTGPDGDVAGLGPTPDRISAAYRRRYADPHPFGSDPRASVPDSERETFRDAGRRLVDALVRHLDETGPARALAERDAIDLAAHLGERLAIHRVPLADAVSMFVAARRPFLAELSVVARRRGVDGGRIGDLFDASTWLLDRLLLAFVAGHEVASREAAVAGRAATRSRSTSAAGEDLPGSPGDRPSNRGDSSGDGSGGDGSGGDGSGGARHPGDQSRPSPR